MEEIFSKSFTVKESETAEAVGSGGLAVLSTPHMISYMENTAWEAVEELLDDKSSTVGMEISVKHMAPTAVGKEVKIIAELINQTEKVYTFQIEAYEEQTIIGKADHKRLVIDKEEFLNKL